MVRYQLQKPPEILVDLAYVKADSAQYWEKFKRQIKSQGP